MSNPSDELRAAATWLRSATFRGAITMTPTVAALIAARTPLTKLLEAAADDLAMCDRINSRDPYNDGATRVLPHQLATDALAVARAINTGGRP